MSAPRLRLTLPTGPLTLHAARPSLLGALWVWSKGGTVASSNENTAALEDLEWLGVEPDAMASAPKQARYEEAAARLEESGAVYRCYCTSAHYREMQASKDGPEPHVYDGRCGRLTPAERAALEKAGRKFRYRLRRPETQPDLPSPWAEQPWPDTDRIVLETDSTPSPALAAAVDDHSAKANASLVDGDARTWLIERALIELALQRPLPELVRIPAFRGTAHSIATLREAGHPRRSLLNALLSEVWSLPDGPLAPDLEDAAEKFSLGAIQCDVDETSTVDDESLRVLSHSALQAADRTDLTATVVEHLTRRGYGVIQHEPDWQEAFVAAVRSDLHTLADAERLAGVLTAPTVDYDRSTLRHLSRPGVGEALDWFASQLATIPDGDHAGWRGAIQAYRQQAASPGRALSTLRLVMTG
ncbi:MAG: glutamate--tRNA ligase family protein, partial [Myxococcota bacterium]|nr:glutamate--tRNA ligase family protein [Myxococcota bacterium]